MRQKPKEEYVYVTVKQAYLRDRVAAVSNRIAIVTNGQELAIVERQRRWVKVKTDKNQTGWIEERSVASASTAAEFAKLKQEHAKDPVVATGSVRDELYMHVKPGRDTDRFYLLPEGEKVQFLARAMAAKPVTAQAIAAAPKTVEKPKPGKHTTKGPKPDLNAPAMPPPDPSLPPQEDWWLVRDSQGHVGWLLSRRLDVDVPDAIAGYAEGQKIVGAYVLTTIQDTGAQRADPNVPIYVVVLNAYKDGLPYDFDQVRVFTWSLKKHRYETAYREHGLQGYLPVTVVHQGTGTDQAAPTFGFRVATGDTVSVNASTGAVKAGPTGDRLYRLDGVIVRRVLPVGQSVPKASGTVKHPKRSAGSPSGRHLRH
jgi:SH3-like domain-containing protein